MKTTFFIALVVCTVLTGCSDLGTPPVDGTPQLSEDVNGLTLSYPRGQKFKLSLDSWADAGYQWDYTLSDSAVVCVEGDVTYRSNNPGVPGGLATATVHFCTGHIGKCVVTMFEHQRWMTGVPPSTTVSFTVLVQ
jgi:opacity protein-like surface antigen